MDISDILHSVSASTSADLQSLDLQALTRAWVNERVAPELLPWPGELVERVMAGVGQLVRVLYLLFPSCISLSGDGGIVGLWSRRPAANTYWIDLQGHGNP